MNKNGNIWEGTEKNQPIFERDVFPILLSLNFDRPKICLRRKRFILITSGRSNAIEAIEEY